MNKVIVVCKCYITQRNVATEPNNRTWLCMRARANLNCNTMCVQGGLNGVGNFARSRTPRSASWTMSRCVYVSYIVLDTSTYTTRLWKHEILLKFFFGISLLVVIWKARKEMRVYFALSLKWCVPSAGKSDRGEFGGGNWLWRLEFLGCSASGLGFADLICRK